MNQVAQDSQLLDTARDYFHFVTKFFEPINVSATHIYHSALELCPSTSIVRRLYYDQCHGITRFPRVVVGTPDSWDPAVSLFGKDKYNACVWSPCGRFIAAQTEGRIEVRNHLTLELLAVLQYPKPARAYRSHLAYSPDGRSLACAIRSCLVIWDIQTGGVVQIIDSHMSDLDPAWSLDGRSIIARTGIATAKTYDVASGAQLFKFEADKREYLSHFWACGESFRVLIKFPIGFDNEMTISEIGPTCTRIKSLQEISLQSSEVKLSPYAYRVSLSNVDESIHALATGTSHRLLSYTGDGFARLSPDGSHLATVHDDSFQVWKYTSGSFVLFREYPFGGLVDVGSLEFSPTSTSILLWRKNIFRVWRLDTPPTPPRAPRQLAVISPSGRHIATAHESQTTVTIADLHSQIPLQLIDTGGQIEGLVITGNVLLVALLSGEVVGWLLTEEGRVSNVAENKVADRGDSIWTTTSPEARRHPGLSCFGVKGKVGMIGLGYLSPIIFDTHLIPDTHLIYDTETGDVLDRSHEPQNFTFPWLYFRHTSDCQKYRRPRYHGAPQYDTLSKDGWLVSHETREEGWVVDPQGRHRFWLPVEWRMDWTDDNIWHHDITTLFIGQIDQPVVIKF